MLELKEPKLTRVILLWEDNVGSLDERMAWPVLRTIMPLTAKTVYTRSHVL